MKSHHETNTQTVHGDGGVTGTAFASPGAKAAGWCAGNGVLIVDVDLSVFLRGHLADEEVVLAGVLAIVGGEAFVLEKQPLAIGEVFAHAHVRLASKGGGEVHHAVLQVLETHQPVEHPSVVPQSAVTDYHLGIVVVTADHAAQPLLAGRHAVEIGKHHEVV